MKVTMLAVVTLDGKLGRGPAHFVNWSSREDKRLFMGETKRIGVVIMGHNTYKTMPAPLPGRLHVVVTHDAAAQVAIPGVVEFTEMTPAGIVADLEARGYSEVVLGGGAQIYTLFLEAGLVDEISLTVEPLIFGKGIDLFDGVQFDVRARLLQIDRLNDTGTVRLLYSLK